MTAPRVDVDELGRLLAAATPGPWHVCEPPDGADTGIANADHDPVACLLDEWYEIDPDEPTAVHDAALIAALVNAAPALLAEVSELRATVARVEALRDDLSAADEHGNPLREGSFCEAADELTAALAALTTTTREDHR